MRSRINGFFIFVVVAVGVAVGVYFASQLSDGTTAAQEGAEKPASTPDALIQQWLAEGTEPPALTITPYPTCPPPTPTPTPGGPATPGEAAPPPWPCIPADQPPPDKTPDLSSLFQRPREPEECETCIDLGKPVPYEVPMKMAGRTIHLPVGSVYVEQFLDYPAGVDARGPTHVHIIKRGQSKVTIDGETGSIVKWNVAPQDEPDFRRLILEPLQES